jgi:t-SNARE complex subunit (syntaxin)
MADDMNRIVYEQQTFFDESEKNVAEADENVSSGIQEITLVRLLLPLTWICSSSPID